MDEVTPWISDYFLNLATTYGSAYNTAPPSEKLKKCQLKKVLTLEPKDYFWIVLSDRQHEVPGRIPKEVVEECLKSANRGQRLTRYIGSIVEIRNFTPLLVRVEDGSSTSATRKVLALEIKRARLRGSAGESIWGTPQPLEGVSELKEWLRELRKPDGDQDILKVRRVQQDGVEAAKQLAECSRLSPNPEPHSRPATYAPAAALRKAASITSTVGERSPMQRYRRKWHQAVPGLDAFAHRLQIPEDVRLKVLEQQEDKKTETKPRSSGTVLTNRTPNIRGALEIGSSPARLGSIPRATTPEEWPTSPGVLKRLCDNHETDMSSDVYSSLPSSPAAVYHDAQMDEVGPQPEPETVPETPQAAIGSQPQHPSPPPPAQPPRPRSPLTSSSVPQMQNEPTSPESIHTSTRAVSGSQLPSSENPPPWARLDDEPSNGPSFELPSSQHGHPPVPAPQPTPGARLSPVKHATNKKVVRGLAFEEALNQHIEQAFRPARSQSVPSSQPLPPSRPVPSSGPQGQHATPRPDRLTVQSGDSVAAHANEMVADTEEIPDPTANTQSSLEYASTQGENKVVDAEPPKLVDKPSEVVVATERPAGEPPTSPLPQIAVIHEVESQQSAAVENEEEVDELEDDSDVGGHRPVAKRKPKAVSSKPPSKANKHPIELEKFAPPSESPSKPASRVDSAPEQVPPRSSFKLPPKPVVVIERKRTPLVLADKLASTAQKRRLATPSGEEFHVPQPSKRSRINGHHPVQTTLPPIPRTPSPLPREGRNPVVSSISRSAKGRERAEREEQEIARVQSKKAPDIGSKRKHSVPFSVQDDSRDFKRRKVAEEPEPRKLGRQLSFVDPDKLKRPFRGKPQIRKTSAQRGTTTTAELSAVVQPDKGEQTSKYFSARFYREPECPHMTATPETELLQKVAKSKEAAYGNGRDSGYLRPRNDPRKTSTSNSDRQSPRKNRNIARVADNDESPGRSPAPICVRHSKPLKNDVEKDLVGTASQYPPARKLGSFAPDLKPPPLLGLPGGRLTNKQLREILIRTGKVRVRESKAVESNHNGR